MNKPLTECPFCGESVRLNIWYAAGSEPMYKVRCVNPDCVIRPSTQYSPSSGTVINQWNSRRKRKICQLCEYAEWDMPQCRECSGLNDWKYFMKRGKGLWNNQENGGPHDDIGI